MIVYERFRLFMVGTAHMARELALSGVERQEQIFQYIQSQQRVSVEQICEQFDVSMATARRDLESLSKLGRVQRIHGGALAVPEAPPEPPLALRSSAQADEKRRIGRLAASLVNDGETVFLGSGTTIQEIAYHLRGKRDITVITNSLLTINALAGVAGVSVIGLGGVLRPSEMSFIGHITEQALRELRADKVFMGIRAIDVKHGLTNDYLPETQTDRAILNVGQQVIVVADNTKCKRVSTTFVASVNVVNTFITDSDAPPDFVEALRELSINVLLA
jgi:DeoR family transcriptional regulator, aga operon transcriptional repressor